MESRYADTLRLLGLALDRNETETKRRERIARGQPRNSHPIVEQALRAVCAVSTLEREALLKAIRTVDAVIAAEADQDAASL